MKSTIDLASCLADIPDRRRAEGKMYGQVGVILFSIIAMLSGARSYRQIHTLIDRRLAILNAAFPQAASRRTAAYTSVRGILQRSATTTRPTRPRRCRLGSPNIRASSCTSHQHRRPGSTWSSGCSPKSPASKSAAAYSRASPNSRLPSRPGSRSATPNRSPSSGPPKPISSSRRIARARRALEEDLAAGTKWMDSEH